MEDLCKLRKTLKVDEYADRRQIVLAYRKLAMQWHPDRNPSPESKGRFQEIEHAYRILQSKHNPVDLRTLWDEMVAKTDETYQQQVVEYAWYQDIPMITVISCIAAIGALINVDSPGNIILFSLLITIADVFYKTGRSIGALRMQAGYRLLVRLYWAGVLAWGVWFMGRKIAGL